MAIAVRTDFAPYVMLACVYCDMSFVYAGHLVTACTVLVHTELYELYGLVHFLYAIFDPLPKFMSFVAALPFASISFPFVSILLHSVHRSVLTVH